MTLSPHLPPSPPPNPPLMQNMLNSLHTSPPLVVVAAKHCGGDVARADIPVLRRVFRVRDP